MYTRIKIERDYNLLQSNLVSMHNWYSENSLCLNITKYTVGSFSRETNIFTFNYKISDTTIRRSELMRELGVWFDIKLNFSEHINIIVSEDTLKMLYYVRSRLEYASIVRNFTTIF